MLHAMLTHGVAPVATSFRKVLPPQVFQPVIGNIRPCLRSLAHHFVERCRIPALLGTFETRQRQLLVRRPALGIPNAVVQREAKGIGRLHAIDSSVLLLGMEQNGE